MEEIVKQVLAVLSGMWKFRWHGLVAAWVVAIGSASGHACPALSGSAGRAPPFPGQRPTRADESREGGALRVSPPLPVAPSRRLGVGHRFRRRVTLWGTMAFFPEGIE